jgi:toxin YoeB
MREIQLRPEAIEDLQDLMTINKKLVERVLRMLKECRKTPFEGIGKPEPLKGDMKGYWSRRVDDEHRMVYEVTDDLIIIYGVKGHYGDK